MDKWIKLMVKSRCIFIVKFFKCSYMFENFAAKIWEEEGSTYFKKPISL